MSAITLNDIIKSIDFNIDIREGGVGGSGAGAGYFTLFRIRSKTFDFYVQSDQIAKHCRQQMFAFHLRLCCFVHVSFPLETVLYTLSNQITRALFVHKFQLIWRK